MKHLLSPLLISALLLGCTEKETPVESTDESVEAVEVVPSEDELIDIEAEARSQAEASINESNADNTLDALEAEIE
jgi:hypothetical protein